MSVIANKRGLSDMQFYKTARDLRNKISLELIPEIEKSNLYDILKNKIINSLLNCIFDIMKFITRANSIYPTSIEEVQKRKLLQVDAISICEHLYELFEYIIDLKSIKINKILKYADDLNYLIKLLRRWKQSNNKIIKAIENKH